MKITRPALLLFLPLAVASAFCQTIKPNPIGTGSSTPGSLAIEVTVVMPNGPAMVTVDVSTATGFHRFVLSDSGRFNFGGVPTNGEATISITADGYQTIHDSVEMRPTSPGTVMVQYLLRPADPTREKNGKSPVSAAFLRVPEPARKEYDEGVKQLLQNHRAEARPHFEKAVAIYAEFPQALQELATLDMGEGKVQDALGRLQQAVKADNAFAEGFVSLSYVLFMLERDQEAADAAERATSLRPTWWRAYFELGKADLALGQLQKADTAVNQMDSIRPHLPETCLLRGGIALKRGDSQTARAQLTQFLEMAPKHEYAALARQTLESIEKN